MSSKFGAKQGLAPLIPVPFTIGRLGMADLPLSLEVLEKGLSINPYSPPFLEHVPSSPLDPAIPQPSELKRPNLHREASELGEAQLGPLGRRDVQNRACVSAGLEALTI